MTALLVVVSGLPGAGKSALADALGREVGAAVLSVDPIEAAIWRSGITPSFETGLAAYEVAAVLAEHQLRLALPVVVDSVSAVEEARMMWRHASAHAGAPMRVIEVVCSDEALHRQRLESRQRSIEGFPEPTWDDVVHRRGAWEPWPDHRLLLDSVRTLDDNLTEALGYLAT